MKWLVPAIFLLLSWLILKIGGDDDPLGKGIAYFMLVIGGVMFGWLIYPPIVLVGLGLIIVIGVARFISDIDDLIQKRGGGQKI